MINYLHKLHSRLSVVEAKTTWSAEEKKRVKDALSIDLMSSEEAVSSDDETVYKVRPLTWRSAECSSIIQELDRKMEQTQSKRPRRQQIKRVKGEPSSRPLPASALALWIVGSQ